MKTVNLVSVSFPGRDLCLGPVSIKNYALKDDKVARNYEINISQFDLEKSIDVIVENLSRVQANIYAFTVYVWNINNILEIAERLTKRFPDSGIVFGGPEASGMARTLMEEHDFVDYIFVGEGEKSFRSFLAGESLSKVPGLVYRDESGLIENPEPSFVDLNELSLPHENEDYRNYLDNSPITVRAAIETSRGCPFNCGYCTWGRQRMRYFDLKKLRPAFEYLFHHPNVRTVYITDSNPFLRRERAIDLIEMLIELNVHKKSVTFELSPEYMSDERILDLLSKLYNDEFALGVQSTSPEVLAMMNRRFNSEKYRRNIHLMKEKNPDVRLWFSLIIGLPGDNYNQFSDSLDYVINLNPEGIYVHELLCLPGSDYYSNPEKYGIEFMSEAPHKILKNKTFPPEQYNRAKDLSYFVYLCLQFENIRNVIYNLKGIQDDTRLVDYYERFSDFAKGKIDYLMGRDIHDVTSWFFESMAQEFLSNTELVEKMEVLFQTFMHGEANGIWAATSNMVHT